MQPWFHNEDRATSKTANADGPSDRSVRRRRNHDRGKAYAVTVKPKDAGAADADSTRGRQLAYSELQTEMLNEESRRRKAAKIISVLQHFLGREDLDGLKALDIGCSTGFISDELHKAGARVTGLDIDEPGLEAARVRFGDSIEFICAGGEDIPAPPQSFDIVIFKSHLRARRRCRRGDGRHMARVAPRWCRLSRAR